MRLYQVSGMSMTLAFNPLIIARLFASRELSQDLFRRYIMQNSVISHRCTTGLLKLIDQERHGETIDRTLIKNLLRMLLDLHVRFDSPSLTTAFLRECL